MFQRVQGQCFHRQVLVGSVDMELPQCDTASQKHPLPSVSREHFTRVKESHGTFYLSLVRQIQGQIANRGVSTRTQVGGSQHHT